MTLVDHGALTRSHKLQIRESDLQFHSPVTEAHVGSSLTLVELVHAAVADSDNTAANLLLTLLGGPRAVTLFARRIGDGVFLLTDYEPQLSDVAGGSRDNSTSSRAMATTYTRVFRTSDALTPSSRDLIVSAMAENEFGQQRITAGAAGWSVIHKTGTGSRGEANDIAFLSAPGRPEMTLCVFTRATDPHAEPSDAAVADATKRMLAGI